MRPSVQPKSFYEIEMKSLLTEEQYLRLGKELPEKMQLFNEETIQTTRYRPGDIRLRHSDKTIEIICKEGDPTTISRREVQIPLPSLEHLSSFAEIFDLRGLKPDPAWIKYKREFHYLFNGFLYVVCLQDIKDFAFILEVEHLCPNNDIAVHEPNIRKIFAELGCQPIEPKDFTNRIDDYIQRKKKKSLLLQSRSARS